MKNHKLYEKDSLIREISKHRPENKILSFIKIKRWLEDKTNFNAFINWDEDCCVTIECSKRRNAW